MEKGKYKCRKMLINKFTVCVRGVLEIYFQQKFLLKHINLLDAKVYYPCAVFRRKVDFSLFR